MTLCLGPLTTFTQLKEVLLIAFPSKDIKRVLKSDLYVKIQGKDNRDMYFVLQKFRINEKLYIGLGQKENSI